MLYSLSLGQYIVLSAIWICGRLAQLVEQVTFNHWVTGSNPVPLTKIKGSLIVIVIIKDLFFDENLMV